MSDVHLPQLEADALIAMAKHKIDDTTWRLPIVGGGVSIPLQSFDRREQFLLDIYKGRINLSKSAYQTRGRGVIVLVRLDVGGPPHRNPDGEEVACPHLHLYREGFGDKWAVPVPRDDFPDPADLSRVLDDFLAFCNVVERPDIEWELFS